MLYQKETALFLLALFAGSVCCVPAISGEQGKSDSPPAAEGTTSPDARVSRNSNDASGNFLWLPEHEGALSLDLQRMKNQLLNSRVPTREKAEGIVSKARSEVSGHGNLTVYRVIDLITIGVDVPGFASRGDMIWIVRVREIHVVKQEAWVSSSTGKIRWMLPFPAENQESATAAKALGE